MSQQKRIACQIANGIPIDTMTHNNCKRCSLTGKFKHSSYITLSNVSQTVCLSLCDFVLVSFTCTLSSGEILLFFFLQRVEKTSTTLTKNSQQCVQVGHLNLSMCMHRNRKKEKKRVFLVQMFVSLSLSLCNRIQVGYLSFGASGKEKRRKKKKTTSMAN